MNWKMVRALAGAILLVLLPTVSRAVPPASDSGELSVQDLDPASPTYGQVVSLARWIGELQHGEFAADGEHLILSHANAYRMVSLYLGKYHYVYLPAILRSN